VYAAAAPARVADAPPLLRSVGGVLVPALFCLMGASLLWTVRATVTTYRTIVEHRG
jgi:hypothetical protein